MSSRMASKKRRRFSTGTFLVIALCSTSFPSVVLAEKEPFVEESILWAGLEDPDAILLKEIEWAQKSMERYRQTTGEYPLRSDSRKAHENIYSEDWVHESLTSLRMQDDDYEKTTRGSRMKGRKDRFLRGNDRPR